MYYEVTAEEQQRVADALAACCQAARRSRESDRAVPG